MSRVFDRLELWTTYVCNAGVLIAFVPLADVSGLSTVERFDGLLVTRRLTAVIPVAWEDFDQLAPYRVLRVVFDATHFDEYVIRRVTDTSNGDGRGTVEAVGPEMDLGAGPALISDTVSGLPTFTPVDTGLTPSQALTNRVLAYGPSYISLGTVTATELIDVAYSADTPLSAALKIAAATQALTGIRYEVSVDRNGTTDYQLNLTAYNAAATQPYLITGRSIVGLRRTELVEHHTTRAYALNGDANAMGANRWYVATLSVNAWIDVVDTLWPWGPGGIPGPSQEADQWLNYYWRDKSNTGHQITGVTVLTADRTRFAMASTAGIAVGDWGRISPNSAGDDLSYVDSPAAQALYGIVVGVLPVSVNPTTNHFLNPDQRGWPGAAPSKWTTSGTGTFAKDTTVFKTAGQAQKMTTTIAPWVPGITTDVITYVSRAAETVTVSVWFRTGNGVSPQMVLKCFLDTVDATGSPFSATAALYPAGAWHRYDWTLSVSAGSHTYQVYAYGDNVGAGYEYWVDSAMVTPGGVVDFVAGSNPTRAIQTANRHLALTANGAPPITYDASIWDLYRIDATYAGQYEQLSLGGTAVITDEDLGIEAVPLRVVQIETNLLQEHDSKVLLANRLNDLTQFLAAA